MNSCQNYGPKLETHLNAEGRISNYVTYESDTTACEYSACADPCRNLARINHYVPLLLWPTPWYEIPKPAFLKHGFEMVTVVEVSQINCHVFVPSKGYSSYMLMG